MTRTTLARPPTPPSPAIVPTRCRAIARFAIGLAIGLAPVACVPSTITLSLEDPPARLREQVVLRDAQARPGARVLLIHVRGLIADGVGGFGGRSQVDELVARLQRAQADPNIRAIVLRINSPGGSVTASQIMHAELRRLNDPSDTGGRSHAFAQRSRVPIVASLGEVAASGGYYIALAADEIVAEPTSVTGSIGVLIAGVNISDGLDRIGVRSSTITSGRNKAMGDPLSPIDPGHTALLQGMVDEFYHQFRTLVQSSRPRIPADRLDQITDGRVVTGRQALDAGLVDSLGSLRDAFDRAKALAGVEHAELVVLHTRPNGFQPRTPYASAEAPTSEPAVAPSSLRVAGVALPIDVAPHTQADALQPGIAYYVWPAALR